MPEPLQLYLTGRAARHNHTEPTNRTQPATHPICLQPQVISRSPVTHTTNAPHNASVCAPIWPEVAALNVLSDIGCLILQCFFIPGCTVFALALAFTAAL